MYFMTTDDRILNLNNLENILFGQIARFTRSQKLSKRIHTRPTSETTITELNQPMVIMFRYTTHGLMAPRESKEIGCFYAYTEVIVEELPSALWYVCCG